MKMQTNLAILQFLCDCNEKKKKKKINAFLTIWTFYWLFKNEAPEDLH